MFGEDLAQNTAPLGRLGALFLTSEDWSCVGNLGNFSADLSEKWYFSVTAL